jgi:regulator of replication initiation timing
MTDDDKSTDDMNAQEIQNLIEENQRLQRENEKLKDITENNILVPKYWFVDEETQEKLYDTDEMESAFHDAMVDLGAYNDELRCEGCDKRFGKTESSFQNAEGLAVCVDCLTSEESGGE